MQTFSEWFLARVTEGYPDGDPPLEVQQQRLHAVSSEVLCHMGATAALVYSDPEAICTAYNMMLEQGFAEGMRTKHLLGLNTGTMQ